MPTAIDLKRAALIGVVVALAVGGAMVMSRAYQQRALQRLFESYDAAPRTPLAIDRRDAGADRTIFTADEWMRPLPDGAGRVVTRFVAVELRDAQCGGASVDLTVRYQAMIPDADLSETIAVPLRPHRSTPTRQFIVAYDRADESIRFRGIEIAADRVDCIATLSRVDGLDRAPLLLNTTLGAGWRQEPLYQRLR